MKILSIKQPWASLIIWGIKDIENRSWTTKYRGPLLIHSSKNPDKSISNFDFFEMMKDSISPKYWNDFIESGCTHGHIIGVVELVGIVSPDAFCKSGWHEEGYFGWYIENPIRFQNPLPYHGKLGLFDCPEEVLQKLISLNDNWEV